VCGVVAAGKLNRGGGGGNTVIQMTVFCSAAAFYHAAFSKFFLPAYCFLAFIAVLFVGNETQNQNICLALMFMTACVLSSTSFFCVNIQYLSRFQLSTFSRQSE